MNHTEAAPDVRHLAAEWLEFWSGDVSRAADLITPDFSIHFADIHPFAIDGDEISDPSGMAVHVERFHRDHPGARFTLDRPPLLDGDSICARWSVDMSDGTFGGIDILRVVDGKIAEVWSVSGGRLFGS